jgi:hypothetical protein
MTKEKTTPKKVVLPKMAACPKDEQVVSLLKEIEKVNYMIYKDQVLMNVKTRNIEQILIMLAVMTVVLFAAIIFKMFIL